MLPFVLYTRLNLCISEGGKYSGEYSIHDATGEVKGCPARASSVRAVVQSIKTREKVKGASAFRNHAEAMSIEELAHLMEWSEQACPSDLLTPESLLQIQGSVEDLKHRLHHGFMRAFLSSGFTLWTRYLFCC